MLMLDVKADKGGQSPLSLLSANEPGDPEAFNRLLKGLTHTLGKGKSIASDKLALLLDKEGMLQEMRPLSEMPSGSLDVKGKGLDKSLLSLLHPKEEPDVKESDDMLDIKILNPKITAQLPAKELTALIKDAKAFLKAEISRISDVEEMPKTLKGLLQLADKVGIDVSKISFEQIVTKGSTLSKGTVVTKESDDLKPINRNGLKGIPTAELIRETVEPETKETKQSEPLQKLLQKQAMSQAEAQSTRPKTVEESNVPKETATTTLSPERAFKQAVEHAKAPVTTVLLDKRAVMKGKEEDVPAQKKVSATTATAAAKATESSISLGALDATPEASSTTENTGKGQRQPLFSPALNELLYSKENSSEDKEESTTKHVTSAKDATSILATSGKDPLELKMNEAKQTLRHFASDIKEAVQNYKPPFTRLKIQLNPVKLGDVDVTMIQRGNNLHINISSNTTAITTLSQNATELRTQLSQNGMGNTTMNFSNNANSEQQQQQQRQHLADLYEEYSNTEEFELMDSLELIIPRYV